MKHTLKALETPGEADDEEDERLALDTWRGRLVNVPYFLTGGRGNGKFQDTGKRDWWVVDVLTQEGYWATLDELKMLNEMEVLAFMASTGGIHCECCGIEGGETYEISSRRGIYDLCTSCYRNSCDTRDFRCPKKGDL